MGPGPIDFPQITAWAALTGASPKPWEVRALRRMDALRLHLHREDEGQGVGGQAEVVESERPLTGELLDALWGGAVG